MIIYLRIIYIFLIFKGCVLTYIIFQNLTYIFSKNRQTKTVTSRLGFPYYILYTFFHILYSIFPRHYIINIINIFTRMQLMRLEHKFFASL